MLKVFCNSKFAQEKDYVFRILFDIILGLDYSVEFADVPDYRISFGNNEIVIRDAFFSGLSDFEPFYKNSDNIPNKVFKAKTYLAPEQDLIGLYGDERIIIDRNSAFIGADFVAATFFMLTRWEEIAIEDRDKHGRFVEEKSLAIKHGFHKRPIVNEYAEFLWNVLQKLGYSENRKMKKFQFYPTHDIDFLFKYDGFLKCAKVLTGDLVKRKSLSVFRNSVNSIYSIKSKKSADVFDTFDFLMDVSESKGLKSFFYFMSGVRGETDVDFSITDRRVVSKIEQIIKRGHVVGIHPTYNSFDNILQFKLELSRLRKISSDIYEGRQHFLRFQNPKTWQIWNDSGLKIDSTIGFYSTIGFRAGICCEYPVFNVETGKVLDLLERPLVLMDTALRREADTQEEFLLKAFEIINTVKKYKGDFVLLWHNNNLSGNEWNNWDKVYLEIVNVGVSETSK
jgi:hypothetical protein